MTAPSGSKTRHVWIVNHYAVHPSGSSGGTRHQSLAAGLAAHGWSSTIFAATTAHSTRLQRPPSTFDAPIVDGVRWQWIPSPSYAKAGLGRVRNMAVFTLRLLFPQATDRVEPPDVVVGSSVHPFAAWAASRLAKRHRVPFVFEVRDLWPETLIDMGAISRTGIVARLLRRLETHLYRDAGLILTTMPHAHRYIETLGIDRGKIAWLSNGTETERFDYSPPPMNRPFNFLYYGSHGKANDLETLIDGFALATRDVPKKSINFTLVGSGPMKARLIDKCVELGVQDAVQFREAIQKRDIPDLAATADALVMSVLPLPLYRFGISQNKLYDYLASCRPILIVGNPSNNPVRDARAGICIYNNDASEIASAMHRLFISTRDERDSWGKRGRLHAIEHYSYSSLSLQFAEHLNRLID